MNFFIAVTIWPVLKVVAIGSQTYIGGLVVAGLGAGGQIGIRAAAHIAIGVVGVGIAVTPLSHRAHRMGLGEGVAVVADVGFLGEVADNVKAKVNQGRRTHLGTGEPIQIVIGKAFGHAMNDIGPAGHIAVAVPGVIKVLQAGAVDQGALAGKPC